MRRSTSILILLVVLALAASAASGCQGATPAGRGSGAQGDQMPALSPITLDAGGKLRVVATTSFVADAVQRVGTDRVDLTMLLPLGADPHEFQARPQDAAAIADADVVFANGAGLEQFLSKLLESAGNSGGSAEQSPKETAGGNVPVVPVSYGVTLRHLAQPEPGQSGAASGQLEADPHTWLDPNNVMIWVDNIAQALSALDPGGAAAYQANASAYKDELQTLDGWIRDQVNQVPEANRRLVTDHAVFGYFADRYGFEQTGTVFPGYSTLAQPSAQEIAALEDAIRAQGVPAIFVGLTINPNLAERVAADTGTQVVFVYTGSLSEPGGPAADYIAFMQYDVGAITGALQ